MFDMPTEFVIVAQHCRLHSVLSEMQIPFGDNVFGGPVTRVQLTDFFKFFKISSQALTCECLHYHIHLLSNYVAHN